MQRVEIRYTTLAKEGRRAMLRPFVRGRSWPSRRPYQASGPTAMSFENNSQFIAVLTQVQGELTSLAHSSETEIASTANTFKSLAGQADAILKRAATIVACVEKESVGAVLPAVQALCLTVSSFLENQFDAAASILVSLQEEKNLLNQLTRVTHRQGAISSHLEALSVLTNVEVAQLGSAGTDFLILAKELSVFSKSIARQTLELAANAESRNHSVEESRQRLAATVPQLRGELNRMEAGINENMNVIGVGLSELARVPGQFRMYVQETNEQIAGVVAAIQAHDITRQQIEHVREALELISSKMTTANGSREDELSMAYAGLIIQVYQLKNIKQTVANWTSQVGRCMEAIRKLSASELVSIGPAVLEQERALTFHLSQIESLQQKSREYTGRIEGTLSGLSSLRDLIHDHQERSRSIRHRLRLLTFNSLIEAQRLSGKGVVVSAIANLIKEVSAEWSAIAEQSKLTLSEIMKLVQQTNEVMEAFSEARSQKLREDQAASDAALESVRAAAAFVASESAAMQMVMDQMQSNLATVGNTGNQLHACFKPLDAALEQMESLARGLETHDPQIRLKCDASEAERLFAASYSTEVERKVMAAALHGAPIPVLEESLAGNDVELF